MILFERIVPGGQLSWTGHVGPPPPPHVFGLQHAWLLLHPKLGVVEVIGPQPEAFSYPVPHAVALHSTGHVLVVVVESFVQYDEPPVPTHLYPTGQMV